jgi:hypothetical protein
MAEAKKKPVDYDARWGEYAEERLVGRTVKSVRYLTPEETKEMGWYSRPLVIEFDDGSLIFPSRDDEGNGAGALFGQGPKPEHEDWTFPVIP